MVLVTLSTQRNGRFSVSTRGGEKVQGDLVLLAMSNEQPAIPPVFAPLARSGDRFLANPWEVERFTHIDDDAEVLVIGAGLTAADVIVTLLRDKPRAVITAILRTGIRPTARPDTPVSLPEPLAVRLCRCPSLFDARHGELDTVRAILAALRKDISATEQMGRPWQVPFDELRDSARSVWMRLALNEKRRFVRHLRRYYDSRRFRYPPQTEAAVRAGERAGRVRFVAVDALRARARPDSVKIDFRNREHGGLVTREFDWVINCSGPSERVEQRSNTFLRRALRGGWIRPAPLGIGLDVNDSCQAIAASGVIQPGLFAVGPMTFATFGYPLGVPFIVDQIARALPAMRSVLAT